MKGVAHTYILAAAQFWHAARVATEAETRELALFYPIGLNLGMACELALKAYLLHCGVTPKTLRHKSIRHNLDVLLTRAIQEGLELPHSEADAIVILNATHHDHFFRYGWVGDEKQISGVRATPDLLKCGGEIGKLIDRIAEDQTVLRRDFSSTGFSWGPPPPVSTPVAAEEVSEKVQAVLDGETQARADFATGKAKVYYPPGQG